MRSKFSKWGLSVLTMVSVATVVLLVTGWGSAVAASVSSVVVANTASNPAQVHEAGTANVNVTNATALPVSGSVSVSNLPSTQQVGGSVSVSNLPATQPVSGTVGISGTPSVSVGNFPSTQAVSGTVNVGNLPAAAQSAVVQGGTASPDATSTSFLVNTNGQARDISAYRSVTLYVQFLQAGQTCDVITPLPTLPVHDFILDSFSPPSGTNIVKTYDPAPPSLEVVCGNPGPAGDTARWMLTGRTG